MYFKLKECGGSKALSREHNVCSIISAATQRASPRKLSSCAVHAPYAHLYVLRLANADFILIILPALNTHVWNTLKYNLLYSQKSCAYFLGLSLSSCRGIDQYAYLQRSKTFQKLKRLKWDQIIAWSKDHAVACH